MCFESGSACYIPLKHQTEKVLEKKAVLEKLKIILEDKSVKKIGQNIKYDALIMKRYGINLDGIAFDTMIAAHLLNPDRRSYKLDNLSIDYLDYEMIPIENLIGPKGKNQKLMYL